jgi:2'-5' RNA ligase
LADLRLAHPDVRWLAPEKLHLTLVFLGPTDPARVAPISSAVGGVSSGHQEFEVETGEGGGRVGDRRGGVAWLRLHRGAAETTSLAVDLDQALGSATYDDRRRPRPHLTVARGVDEALVGALRAWSLRAPPMSWTVDRLVLFRSHTGPSGSRYEALVSTILGV